MSRRELIEKAALAGIGALSLTGEKAQAIVDDLVRRGEVRRDKAQELIDRLVAKGEEERASLRQVVREEIDRGLSGLNLVTSQDIEALNTKIDALGTRLQP